MLKGIKRWATGLYVLSTLMACGSLTATESQPTPIISTAPTAAPTSPANEAPIYDPQANADAAITAALANAQTSGKNVLLDFGADWCPDCVVLDELFKSATVAPLLADSYEVVHIDVGKWDNNLKLASRYDDPIKMGIPAVVILSPDGEILASTRNGELANARTATPEDIRSFLAAWAPQQ